MIEAVILAAGIGQRLDASPEHLPKALTILPGGESILGRMLALLKKEVDAIRIVVGYRWEMIQEAFPHIPLILNPQFQETNTAKSLLLGLQGLEKDLLFLNGDLVFQKNILQALLDQPNTAMIVNQIHPDNEAVKYYTGASNHILRIGKQLKRAEGESLGMHFFRQRDVHLLKKHLGFASESDFFEVAIQGCIEEGLRIQPVYVEENSCIEIDFPQDLQKANALVQQWEML